MQTLVNLGEDAAEAGATKMDRVVRALRHLLHHDKQSPQPTNSNSGVVPSNKTAPANSNTTVAGTYNQDGLNDPQIIDPVTGSGGGPLIRT